MESVYRGRKIGSIEGSAGAAFSLNATKNVAGAEGGILTTDDDELAVEGQRVERQEVDLGRDVLREERVAVGVPVGTGRLGVDADDVDVERVDVARVARQGRDPG